MEPNNQIPLIDVTAEPVPLPPPEKTLYLVLACGLDGVWSVRYGSCFDR